MTAPPPPSGRLATADVRLNDLFGDTVGATRPSRRRKVGAVVALTVIALAAFGLVSSQASGSDLGNYRTTTVSTHDVDALLSGVATIQPLSQAAVGFPVSGTVATVDIAIGDSVAVGQRLATLDTTSLESSLHTKQAALTAAQLTLANSLDAADAARNTTTTSPAATTRAGSLTPDAAKLAVVEAQAAVDAAITAADQALATAGAVCSARSDIAHSDTAHSDTPTSTTLPPAASSTTSTVVGPPSDASTAICQQAERAVSTAQAAVSAAQHKLLTAAATLDANIGAQAASTNAARDSGSSATLGTAQPAGGGALTGQGSPMSTDPSSEDLIAAQQAVDAAFAQVAVATQALDQATIVSPIQGSVIGLGLEPGDSVAAASSSAVVTIVGTGGYEIATKVSVDKIADVKLGQQAIVQPDGSESPLHGEVVSVAAAPEEGTTSTTYLVIVGLADPNVELDNGATATISIVTDAAKSALAVPTSAVTTTGANHSVTVVSGASAKQVDVTLGVVGDRWTEIRSGVTAGQQVVLADLDEGLPGTATATTANRNGGTTFTFPGGGSLPGGGAIPGGGAFPGSGGFRGRGTPGG